MIQKNRALFIDLLKGLALIVMIEVHVFNSMLLPALKQSWIFDRLNFINGLVAPSFSFASGLVFVLSLHKGGDQLRIFDKDFLKKLSRIGLIFYIGYSLHLPYYSWTKLMNNLTQPNLESLFTVDILQLISTGLFVLLAARAILKTEKQFFNFALIITLVVLILSPTMWNFDFANYMPLFFSNYINKMHGSLFPIFPWWAFVFSGAYTAKFYLAARDAKTEQAFARKLVINGAAFYLTSVVFMYVIFPALDIGLRPNPLWFSERFGIILFLLGIFWFYLNKKENYKSLILDVSRESLLIYWVHLQIIYRAFFDGKSFVDISNQSYGFLQCTLFTIALIIPMLLLAKGWGMIKKNYPHYSRWISVIVLAGATIIFFLR